MLHDVHMVCFSTLATMFIYIYIYICIFLIDIFPTVGTTGEGIDEAMVWLTKQFQRRSSTETGTSNSFYTRIVNKLCGIFLDQVY